MVEWGGGIELQKCHTNVKFPDENSPPPETKCTISHAFL